MSYQAIFLTFGRLKAQLRQQGQPIEDFDLLIASTAVAQALRSNDRRRSYSCHQQPPPLQPHPQPDHRSLGQINRPFWAWAGAVVGAGGETPRPYVGLGLASKRESHRPSRLANAPP